MGNVGALQNLIASFKWLCTETFLASLGGESRKEKKMKYKFSFLEDEKLLLGNCPGPLHGTFPYRLTL